jgi:hypothetical protein
MTYVPEPVRGIASFSWPAPGGFYWLRWPER